MDSNFSRIQDQREMLSWQKIRCISNLLLMAFPWLFLYTDGLAQWQGREEILAAVEKGFGPPDGGARLTPREFVWLDRAAHRVVVDGYIAIQDGPLEMFACPVGTKEHESVVAVFAKAATVHAALLAAGAKTGRPVQWEPDYTAPTGSEIEITAQWADAEGKLQTADARSWIRYAGDKKKHLEPNWVFAGSGFWQDPDSKEKRYLAEAGDLVCVSNFSTATLDIPIKSTEAKAGLMFIADSERIPKSGTPVRLIMQIKSDSEKNDAEKIDKSESEKAKPEDKKVKPETANPEQE